MKEWIASFEQAMRQEELRREQEQAHRWLVKTAGVLVAAAIALVAQWTLFT